MALVGVAVWQALLHGIVTMEQLGLHYVMHASWNENTVAILVSCMLNVWGFKPMAQIVWCAPKSDSLVAWTLFCTSGVLMVGALICRDSVDAVEGVWRFNTYGQPVMYLSIQATMVLLLTRRGSWHKSFWVELRSFAFQVALSGLGMLLLYRVHRYSR